MDVPLHVMRTSLSLCTLTLSPVKIEMLPPLHVLPTIIKDVGNSLNMSACTAVYKISWNGSLVTYCPFLMPPLATLTCLFGFLIIGIRALFISSSLM